MPAVASLVKRNSREFCGGGGLLQDCIIFVVEWNIFSVPHPELTRLFIMTGGYLNPGSDGYMYDRLDESEADVVIGKLGRKDWAKGLWQKDG